MTILDTNAVSEALKPVPSDIVLRWLTSQDPLGLFVTVITQAEILYGIEILPAGKRKHQLSAAAGKLFYQHFRDRILPSITIRHGSLQASSPAAKLPGVRSLNSTQ